MYKNKPILKFIIRIIYFSGFSLVIYYLLLIIWGTFLPFFVNQNLPFILGKNGHTYTRLKEADTVKNVDILFIGSSHVFKGMDPRNFKKNNLKIFDLSSVDQSPLISRVLFEKYINTMKPKLIVLDIYPVILDKNNIEAEVDYLSATKFSLLNLELAFKSKNVLLINTFLYSSFYHFSGIEQYYPKEPKKRLYDKYNLNGDYDMYIYAGYVETSYENGDYYHKNINLFKPLKLGFYPPNIKELEKLISLIKEHNIKYMIIQAPVVKEYYNSILNNKEMDEQFSKYGTYYNFNTILDIPTHYFYDSNHLTQKGVNLYNEEFIKIMQKDSTFISALK